MNPIIEHEIDPTVYRRRWATLMASLRSTVRSQAMKRSASTTGADRSAISMERWYASSASSRSRVMRAAKRSRRGADASAASTAACRWSDVGSAAWSAVGGGFNESSLICHETHTR